jgi:predicted metal-dependent phosphoesterase TrpH
MTGTLIDLHMHTVKGAYDSGLQPEDLAAEAKRIGLTAVAITEHDRLWDRHSLADFRDGHQELLVENGIEVSTDLGHIIAVGLPAVVSGIHRLARLREVADEVGAYLIAAHPFRHWTDPIYFSRQGKPQVDLSPEHLATLPVFEYVDAVEALNGATPTRENLLALQVGERLGKPCTGGSDCHSKQGIGYYCTAFERHMETAAMLVVELHAGRFVAAHGLPAGNLQPFSEASLPQDPLAPAIYT